jgi:hypothetical protein
MGGPAGPAIRERKTDVQRALTSRRSHLDRKVGPPGRVLSVIEMLCQLHQLAHGEGNHVGYSATSV